VKHSGRDILLGGVFLALALLLPVVFHAVGLGSTFLPMFIPLVVAGYLVAFPVAVSLGLIAPITSSLLTGMPPIFPPIAFVMMAEGVVLAGVPALLYQKKKLNIWVTLVVTMLVDRLVLLGAVLLAAKWLELPGGILGVSSLIRGIPGVILIFVIVPPLVKKMKERMHNFAIVE